MASASISADAIGFPRTRVAGFFSAFIAKRVNSLSLFSFPIHLGGGALTLGRKSREASPRCLPLVGGGLYSAGTFDLTPENVDLVLEDVRPYLIADGGNVDVVDVQDGVVSLKLQGACGACPSSSTTMKMGIERVLKEKFGESIREIRQVYDEVEASTSVEAVHNHLDILRPAIANFGGSVEVLSVDNGDCHIRYVGPESIGNGIKAAIKEKFQDIVNIIVTN